VCEQGRIDDVVFEQGLNCGGYNVVCPPVEGLRWVVCVLWWCMEGCLPPSSIHSDKELCKKNHFRLLLNCSQLYQFGFFSLQNVFEDRALFIN